jgi:hypothetical protein
MSLRLVTILYDMLAEKIETGEPSMTPDGVSKAMYWKAGAIMASRSLSVKGVLLAGEGHPGPLVLA